MGPSSQSPTLECIGEGISKLKPKIYWVLALLVTSIAIYRYWTAPQPSAALVAWFARSDVNQDGAITIDEFNKLASPADSFQLYDENRDQQLDIRELEHQLRDMNPHWYIQEPR